MACPRCGCRMLSKAGRGSNGRLICSDCGFQLPSDSLSGVTSNRRSQLITVILISVFGLTAAGLMTIKDRGSSSLLDDEAPLNLQEPRSNASKNHRFNSVLPRTTSVLD